MLARLLQTVWVCLFFFFGEETKTKYCLGIRKVKYETMVGVELFEGYKRAVCDTCRYSIFGKIPWRTSP